MKPLYASDRSALCSEIPPLCRILQGFRTCDFSERDLAIGSQTFMRLPWDWEMVVQVFRAVRSRRGDKGRNDRRFLEALHYFTLHNINWRALPAEFGNWNSVWKRFWRLSRAGVFEAFFVSVARQSGSENC